MHLLDKNAHYIKGYNDGFYKGKEVSEWQYDEQIKDMETIIKLLKLDNELLKRSQIIDIGIIKT